MNVSPHRIVGARLSLRSRWAIVLALALLGIVASRASAQQDDTSRDTAFEAIAREFGAQGKVVAAVERLGGKVEYDTGGPGKTVVGINFSGSRVTDADLASLRAPLKFLPELESLDLSATKITDAGLVSLNGLDTLSRVKLARTRVSEAGVARLLRELPHVMVSRRPRSLVYIPDGWIDLPDGISPVDLYSDDLYAMGEPSLWSLSRKDREAVAYRFLWLPSFHPPLAVRVTPSGHGAILHAVLLDEVRGDRGAKPAIRRTVELTRDQWTDLKHRIDDAQFWSMPSRLWTKGIADGAGYVVEGIEGGKYHVVDASSNPRPDDRYRRYIALCETIVELSGLDIMKLWKRFKDF